MATNKGLQNMKNTEITLIDAIKQVNITLAKELVNSENVNAVDEEGITPLMRACFIGAKGYESDTETPEVYSQDDLNELIQLLIAKGADINTETSNGETALLAAAWANNTEAIKLLIDKGAEVNIKTNSGLTLLHVSTIFDNIEMLKFLIDNGTDINAIDIKGDNLLIKALEECRIDTAKMLISKGLDVNFIPEDGISALMTVCLMNTKNDRTKENLSGSTLARFEMYSQDDYFELIELLIANGADVNAKGFGGMTALGAATSFDNTEAIKLLIEKGADVNAKDNNGQTALFYATTFDNAEAIRLLIDNGANVNQKIKMGSEEANLLSFVVMKDWIYKNTSPEKQQATLNTIQLFIDKGADVNAGFPLFYAAFMVKSKEITQLLIDNGADIDRLTHDAVSILDMLVSHGHYEMLKLFIQKGADINLKNISGKTPLLGAIGLKENDPFEKIHKDDSRNALEKLLLLESYEDGNADRIIKLLVESGTNLNTQCDITKNTALMQAVKYNDYESIKLLLNHGADVDIQDSHGLTALMYAENKKIRNLLLRSDAKGLLNLAELKEKIAQNDLRKSKDSSEDILSLPEQSSVSKDTMLMRLYEYKKKTNPKMISAFEQKDAVFLKEATKELKTLKYVNVLDLIKEKFPLDFIEVVLQKGGDVNITDSSGDTPLIYCARVKDIEIINLLLRYGADINVANYNNFDPIDVALNSLDYEMAKFLLEYGKDNQNRPQELVELLKNFTLQESIMRFTVHKWELFHPKKSEYKNFEGYMSAVKKQFDGIKTQLQEFSPNLYKKIYTFLIDKNPDDSYSWCQKTKINIGWSSLDGLKEWCDSGNDAFAFPLKHPILMPPRKQIVSFGEIINLFKLEIEIRAGYKIANEFNIEFSKRDFYTDTEKFSGVLSKIFNTMNDQDEKYQTKFQREVTTADKDDGSIEIRITQLCSYSSRSAKELLERGKQAGDISEIKKALKNLCDWSVESSFGDESFRVNFLHSNNDREIEIVEGKPAGYTHVFRFYK
jgi:ankyrin repeat protein